MVLIVGLVLNEHEVVIVAAVHSAGSISSELFATLLTQEA